MNKKQVLKKSEEVVSRDIEGQVMIMPLYRSSDEINCIYTLNETAAACWALIDGETDIAGIQQKLMEVFDVEEKVLDENMETFIKDLKEIRAIA